MKNVCVLFLFVSAGLFSCRQPDHTGEPEQLAAPSVSPGKLVLSTSQIKNSGIVSALPEKGVVSNTLRVNGIVEVPPQNLVSVSFPLGGYLSATELLPGMHVNKGQVIAWMEDPSYIQIQQEYLATAARITYLEKTFNRQKALNTTKANSDQALEKAESELQLEKIQWRGLREKLLLLGMNPDGLSEEKISRKLALRAPINGFVSKVNVNIGKYVNPTDVLFELVNPDDIHAALTVFEKDIPSLKIGQQVEITLTDRPDEIHEAEIILITKNLDENGAVVVHCHFEEEDHSWLPGMFLNAAITVSGNQGWKLPEEAVVRWKGKHFIFLDEGEGTFTQHEVSVLGMEKGYAIVDGKWSVSAKAVTKNAYVLLSALNNTGEEE